MKDWGKVSGKIIEFQALWPGAMAILAGIDLLGKFLVGEDVKGKVGERFRLFVSKYFQGVQPKDAETIYQLRNSLMHSFGLYSTDWYGRKYRFTLIRNNGSLVKQQGNDGYQVDLEILHELFKAAIAKYKADVEKEEQLQANFDLMFENYGTVFIGSKM